MWRRLYNRRAQSTGEYALVFAIILGAIVAMQTYVKRGVQGRVKAGTDYMARETTTLGDVTQYDPYYYESDYTSSRQSDQTQSYTSGASGLSSQDVSTRESGGETVYNRAEWQDVNP
ncbi:MAG: hypothetical protein JW869_06115 [Candidatus Omnitrophica bacterium]|nr:hypothetical protein [Candidatus Omnitrophota bacterium]